MTGAGAHNRRAWDRLAAEGHDWTMPATSEEIHAARAGSWHILLTPGRPVPRDWFPPLAGTRTLCLAGSGGQQAPTLAAAGAQVTSVDISARQLAHDRDVARREGLVLATVQADMCDLGMFADGSFDLVVHPCSNCFVPDVEPVWREAARVLAPGGLLLAGFVNPLAFVFDEQAAHEGALVVRHRLPYTDATHLDPKELAALHDRQDPLIFSHSLDAQLGGQIRAGLVLTAVVEQAWPGTALSLYAPSCLATRAVKPERPFHW